MRVLRGVVVAALAMTPAAAGTDFSDLTPGERVILHAEIRAVLLAHPELLLPGDIEPQDAYADEIADDLALIASHADALFASAEDIRIGRVEGPADMAVFVDHSANNDSLMADLADLTASDPGLGIAVKRDTALADSLGLDLRPSFVLPTMMVRGDVPMVVIARYLAQ